MFYVLPTARPYPQITGKLHTAERLVEGGEAEQELQAGREVLQYADGVEADVLRGGTWLWAWGNQGSDFAENIVRDSFALQRYGKENGIAWLTERTFELEQDDVEAVAAVAVGITQADGYYLAFQDAGIAVFALRDPRLKQALAAENPARATVVIPEMVATFVLYQQHEAVAEYLRQAGYQIEQSENGKHIGITAQRNGSVLKADFEDGFFRDLSAQLQK